MTGSPFDLVPIPDKNSMNTGILSLSHALMMQLLGTPGALTVDCSPVTNARLRAKIKTVDVGPFSLEGHEQSLTALRAIFLEVQLTRSDLVSRVGTAGVLCCRQNRRNPAHFSNHSWGMAVDLKFQTLDPQGSTHCRRGLLDLYPFFHRAGWYWGAEFGSPDPMHFEPGMALMQDWNAAGLLL